MQPHDPLFDLHHYSPTLTIIQVIKFSMKKDLGVTRAMVQNYIRDGLLPPPNGRVYTHKHLAALVIIQKLKTVFDMPTIKAALTPHLDAEGLPLDTYTHIMEVLASADKQWEKYITPAINRGEGTERLNLMAHIAALKTRV